MSALARRSSLSVVEADRMAEDAISSIEDVHDPDAAEQLLTRIKLAAEAIRLAELGREYEQKWGRIRLMGERRYGELLGPAMTKQEAGAVTRSHSSTEPEVRKQAERARKVAAVPEQVFDKYIARAEKPSRTGLLRAAKEALGDEPRAEPRYTHCPTCGHRVRKDQLLREIK